MLPLKRPRSGILYIALSVILVFHYFSHDPSIKPEFIFSFKMSTHDLWNNIFNLFGMINFLIYKLIGVAAFVFPIFLFVVGYNRVLNRKQRTEDREAMLMLFALINISLIAGLYDLLRNSEEAYTGGWLGHTAIGFLYNLFSKFFTTVIIALLTYLYISRFKLFKRKGKKVVRKIDLRKSLDSVVISVKNLFELLESFIKNIVTPEKTTDFGYDKKTRKKKERPINEPVRDIDDAPTQVELPSSKSDQPFYKSEIHKVCERNKFISSDKHPPAFPPFEPITEIKSKHDDDILKVSEVIEKKLLEFNITSRVVNSVRGPVITRYELKLAPAVKISNVENLTKDIALAIGSKNIRFEIPIPGKNTIGIEIPNKKVGKVQFSKLVNDNNYKSNGNSLLLPIGVDITGKVKIINMIELPHLLVGGATGSGKSVFLNSLLCSLLLRNGTSTLRLILIDMKRTELTLYNEIPHLLCPVVTESSDASDVLAWLIDEMENRYKILEKSRTRDLEEYNAQVRETHKILPRIVTVIDEMADLMMQSSKHVERSIIRLAQLARAVGIHLVVATQRPSVKIITGDIKANFPSRIAFRTYSNIDSRVILDDTGAEKLVGKGDMLFRAHGQVQRFHGGFIRSDERNSVVDYWRK